MILQLIQLKKYVNLIDMENNATKTPLPSHSRSRDKIKPNIVHPTMPGAVGSHESPYQEERDTISDSRLIIEDTIKNTRGKSS
jgi:hypothetical protein